MSILEKINEAIKDLRKSSSPFKVKALIMLKADIIDDSKSKKPKGELSTAQAHHKSLLKTIDVYRANNCNAHADQFQKDSEVVAEFLPKQLSKEDLIEQIDEIFNTQDFSELTMGEIIGKIKVATGSNLGKVIADEVKRRK